jgi:hypothetical protein
LSHANPFDPYPEPVKVREPVARPLDVVAMELLLSASQAFLVGVLMYLAVGVWGDRGVGLGSVAVILALLGLAVGGGWLFWLLGGVGWPMAAANVPVAMFLGFALVLAWAGDDLFRVAGAPLVLAALASVYGIVGGVFIDSPRRWRWDQRQKLRKGTKVPRVSPATQALIAAVPRSLPQRAPAPDPASDLAVRIERSRPPGPAPSGDLGIPYVQPEGSQEGDVQPAARPAIETDLEEAESVPPATAARPESPPVADTMTGRPTMPTARLEGGARTPSAVGDHAEGDPEPVTIELPNAVEPSAQRSPWAWAAPPEWNRDEDDAGPSGRSSGRA